MSYHQKELVQLVPFSMPLPGLKIRRPNFFLQFVWQKKRYYSLEFKEISMVNIKLSWQFYFTILLVKLATSSKNFLKRLLQYNFVDNGELKTAQSRLIENKMQIT